MLRENSEQEKILIKKLKIQHWYEIMDALKSDLQCLYMCLCIPRMGFTQFNLGVTVRLGFGLSVCLGLDAAKAILCLKQTTTKGFIVVMGCWHTCI